MYYVYEFFIVETNEIIYVGKGTRNRYRVKSNRNQFLTNMLDRFECDSRIVKWFDDEKDAFEYEYNYIKQLKQKGQCVCNIHNGGAGGSGEYWTAELRKEYSDHNVMKSKAQRERMSANNPMKNHDVAKRVATKKSKPVIIGDNEYASVKEASQRLLVSTDTIILWCKKGINYKGEQCRYKNKPQVVFSDQRYNKGSCKAVIYKGIEYECSVDLAKAIGIGKRTAFEWLRRGFDPSGEPCRYKDDKRVLTYENRYLKRNKARAKTIIVNGKTYQSCEEASKILNIPKSTLYSYLQGAKHNPNYICEYGNQQPSQGNFDNSTLEGSTTNG